MFTFRSWQRWTWDEIYTALSYERGLGGAFEVPHHLAGDPLACGAMPNPGTGPWDYRFSTSTGQHLYVRDMGNHYAAYLEEGGPSAPPAYQGPVSCGDSPSYLMAAGGVFLVFFGGLWVLLQAAGLAG